MTGETFPGLTSREVASLVREVSTDIPYPDESSVFAAAARAALSAAFEPGDTDAALLVGSLGAPATLHAVIGDTSPQSVRAALSDAGAPALLPIDRLRDALGRWRSRLPRAPLHAPLERAARLGARLVSPEHPLWPTALDGLELGAPLTLWVRGDPARLARLEHSIALVGARAASPYGEHVALESAAGLSDRGFAIVSGGAYGVDAAAHRAALSSDQVTVAFLAGGVDRLYPAGNDDLLQRIARSGLLTAELPPGSTPTRWRFLIRKSQMQRIMSKGGYA